MEHELRGKWERAGCEGDRVSIPSSVTMAVGFGENLRLNYTLIKGEKQAPYLSVSSLVDLLSERPFSIFGHSHSIMMCSKPIISLNCEKIIYLKKHIIALGPPMMCTKYNSTIKLH